MKIKRILLLFSLFAASINVYSQIASPEDIVTDLYKKVCILKLQKPDWDPVRELFLPEAAIVLRNSRTTIKSMSVDEFIQDFQDFVENSNVLETGFTETILKMKGEVFGNIAWYSVVYEAAVTGTARHNIGVDHISLARLNEQWKIISIVNEITTEDRSLPSFLEH